MSEKIVLPSLKGNISRSRGSYGWDGGIKSTGDLESMIKRHPDG